MKKGGRTRVVGQGPLKTCVTVAKELGVSPDYVNAVKKVAGIRSFFIKTEQITSWLDAHPEFRKRDAYPDRRREDKEKLVRSLIGSP